MGPGASGGDGSITKDLLARLRRLYYGRDPDMPGAVLVTEVGWNGVGGTRRCDALAVGFTSTSGRLLIGHEVKASRGDWLRELASPGKADGWGDQCHEWYVVAPPGVVKTQELPPGWGLLQAAARGLTKVVPATRHEERQPSWDAVRSILARLDTMQRVERAEIRLDLGEKVRAEYNRALEDLRGSARLSDGADWKQRYDALVAALGAEPLDDGVLRWRFERDGDRPLTVGLLREIAEAARDLGTVQRALDDALEGRAYLVKRMEEGALALTAAAGALRDLSRGSGVDHG